jgi:membrane protein DedA with SNARE-associated domain
MTASLGDVVHDVITAAGYPGLALLVCVEQVFPPIPSEVILPLAGYYVNEGDFNFLAALAAATVGAVAGSFILYELTRRGGRPMLLRHGHIFRLREKDLDRADVWFERYGAWLVLLGRLVPGARSLVSVSAGLSNMPRLEFAALTVAGSATWNAALIGAGWALGSSYDEVGEAIGPVGTAVGLALVVGGVVGAIWWFRRRMLDEDQ